MFKIDVLNHGYLSLIETWGSDERIIEAARMSTNKGFQGWGILETCERCVGEGTCTRWGDSDHDDDTLFTCPNCKGAGVAINKPGDEKLLAYLWENKHATPFEMAGAVVEVQAPISVFRQWHRHRTQSYNEMSARYTPLPDLNYVPTVERLMMANSANKQAGTVKGADVITVEAAEQYRRELIEQYEADELFYQRALKMGVPKELAREHLPVGRYSRMRASANLRNWLAFLTLRADAHAQWEIRQYANVLAEFVRSAFPRTHALWVGDQ